MAVISPSVPVMSLFGIYRSSSLLWLRRRTWCSASVPVTGGPVSAGLLHRQLDLVTGTAALLAVDLRERAPFARAREVACRTGTRPGIPRGKPLSRSQRYMPHASASRPKNFSRCAGPPPRPLNRSSRTVSCRGRSPAPLVQRAGGLRCSRLHSGACSPSPRLLPVRSRLPHKAQFTRISYLASASPSPRTCGAVPPAQASTEKLVRHGPPRFRQDALAAGGDDDHAGLRDGPRAPAAGQPNRRGRDDALLDALPDAVGLARLRGSVAPASRRNTARLEGVSRTGSRASRRADGQDRSQQRVFGLLRAFG
jgi:hypothetical protein